MSLQILAKCDGCNKTIGVSEELELGKTIFHIEIFLKPEEEPLGLDFCNLDCLSKFDLKWYCENRLDN